jgi:hypothetical protein
VKCTGETFGFVINEASSSAAVNDDSLNSDDENSSHASISSAADTAADELLDLDTGVYENEVAMASQLPASSQWMAMLHGKFRAYGRVSGNI